VRPRGCAPAPARLGQVFLNLIMNAAHALAAGIPSATGSMCAATTMETTWVIEVEDNGPGIPVEVLPRIFESFFTTQAAGRGYRTGAVHLARTSCPPRVGELDRGERAGPRGSVSGAGCPLREWAR